LLLRRLDPNFTDLVLPDDFPLFDLIFFTFGTFDDFVLMDLDLGDFFVFLLSDFRLFKSRVGWSPDADNDLTLPLPPNLEDFKALILGTFDDFPLTLLAFLVLTDLLVAFKIFDDLTLPEEYTDEIAKNAMAIKAMMDVYLLDMMLQCFYCLLPCK